MIRHVQAKRQGYVLGFAKVMVALVVALTMAPGKASEPGAADGASRVGIERGAVTNLPLPRFVSLKGREGNARRGPSLEHRIDWVFQHPGMPLKITAEYENWRRVEDVDGEGGWIHYALLSGVRTVMVTGEEAELRDSPRAIAQITARAEKGAILHLLSCNPDWCDLSADGTEGWMKRSDFWGVLPGETLE